MGIACAMSHIPDNTRVAAVASSIWTEYYKACEASLQGRQLDMIMLDMEVCICGRPAKAALHTCTGLRSLDELESRM